MDVREVKLADLRDRIGLVPQKGVLFSGTIESNIAYAGNVTDGDTVRWAAKIAQADTFIGEKPDGYDSEIAQGGHERVPRHSGSGWPSRGPSPSGRKSIYLTTPSPRSTTRPTRSSARRCARSRPKARC